MIEFTFRNKLFVLALTLTLILSLGVAVSAERAVPVGISEDGSAVLMTGESYQGLAIVDSTKGKATVVTDGLNAGVFPTISASGDFVGYKAFRESKGQRLQAPMLYDVAAGKSIQLYDFVVSAGTPAVASDGKIAFTIGNDLVVLDAEMEVAGLYDLGHYVNLVAFSPGGESIAFNSEGDQIAVLDLESGEREILTKGKAAYWGPKFSPQGDKILANVMGNRVAVLSGGTIQDLGEGTAAGWADNTSVVILRKTIAEDEVAATELVTVPVGRVAVAYGAAVGKSKPLANGDADAVVSPGGMAVSGEGAITIDKKGAKSGAIPVELPAFEAIERPAKGGPGEKALVDNGTIVTMNNVPYVNQVYDTPSWHNGHWSCNATAAIMCLAYHNLVPSRAEGYGWYVANVYSNNGVTYNICSLDPNGNCGYGGYGYIVRNNWADTKGYMRDYFNNHGASSAVDWSPSFSKAVNEINNQQPFVVLTSLTAAGHYITCIGYYKNQYTLYFNDPYGDKNYQYPGPYGYDSAYDWPGYNNGWMNLNTVHCFIWCRYNQGPPPYQATYVSNTFPAQVVAGEQVTVSVTYQNSGSQTWNSLTRLATTDPRGRSSDFYTAGNWVNVDRPTECDQASVAPGSNGSFTFVATAPMTPGNYQEKFELVQDGTAWFDGSGDNVTWYVEVIEPPKPDAPTGLVASHLNNTVGLDWNDNAESDLAGYNVYRASTQNGTYTKLNASLLTASAYTDTLANGSLAFYYVEAVNDASRVSDPSAKVIGRPNGTETITIEAEGYDVGGQNVAYYDTDGGNNGGALRADDVDLADYSVGPILGWTAAGEWLRFSGVRANASDYDVTARVASAVSGGSFHLEVNGQNVTGTVTAPGTGGWDTWTTVNVGTISLQSGTNTIKVVIEQGSWNLDKLELVESSIDTTPPAVPSGLDATPGDGGVGLDWSNNSEGDLAGYNVYRAVFNQAYVKLNSSLVTSSDYTDATAQNGIAYLYKVAAVDTSSNESARTGAVLARPHASANFRLQAEDYDLGGQNVAYSDTDSGNNGGAYRSEDVDIANYSVGNIVGWIAAGEWLRYSDFYGTGGSYTLTARLATIESSGLFHVEINGQNVTGTITVPNTGGWDTWTTLNCGSVTVPSGSNTIKIVIEQGPFNIDYLDFAVPSQYVLDNDQGSPGYVETGTWSTSSSNGYNGGTYRYAYTGQAKTATWNVNAPASGNYRVEVFYRAGTNRATSAKYNIQTASGTQTVYVNQQQNNLTWVDVGTFSFNQGAGSVTLDAAGSSGGTVVISDAVRITSVP